MSQTPEPAPPHDSASDTRVVSAAVPASGGVQVGDVIADKYKVESIIGRGGMGVVVAAEHLQLRETVALKFLLSAGEDEREFRQRFLREAQVSAKLRGEHVVRLMDFGAPDGAPPYIVMERLHGTDLRETLNHFGKIPIENAIEYVAQACEGVAEAHSIGVVHRDLKPSNLFLTKRLDGSDLVKILDFGVSKARATADVDDDLTSAGSVLGSPRYMSPEQLRNSIDVDARADVWSLGAILYEVICGRPPFKAESTAALCAKILGEEPPTSMRTYRPEVSPALEAAVLRCLERDPAARTPSVAALVAELAEAVDYPWLRASAARVAAVLERRSVRGDPATGSFSGSGRLALSLGAPSSSKMLASGAQRGSTPSMSSSIIVPPDEAPDAGRRRSPVVLLVMGGIALAGVVGVVLVSRDRAPAPSPPAPAAPVAAPAVSSTGAATAAPAPPPVESAARPAESATAALPAPTVVHAPPRHIARPASPPAAAPTTPPAAPPKKANPLGDRL
ncbi:MAG: serine/threonine protein kinase [Polyangiaceae bacterium]|nr:serine/threonine protein kinase [Polyangiaceae bacterium]